MGWVPPRLGRADWDVWNCLLSYDKTQVPPCRVSIRCKWRTMNVMEPNLRPVQPLHYAPIADWLDSAEATQRWAGPGVPFPLPPERFAQVLELEVRPGWALLDEQGVCVGFGQYWMTATDTAHLGRIIVSPHVRGRGLGRALMQALCTQAQHEDGVQHLTLRVYRDNAAAAALYRDLGFQQVEASSTPELLFMRRTLA